MKVVITKRMNEIIEFFKELDNTYFVGGCVRDLVMGIEPKDYDLVTKHSPDEVEAYIRNKQRKPWIVGKRFGSVGVKIENELVEVTTFRKEIYDFQSRKPTVIYSDRIEDDIGRRDFTINSLVCDFEGYIKNYNNGLDDIKSKTLKCVGNPTIRFKEDPLRILRAIRFGAKFNFAIEENTLVSLNKRRWHLLRLSKERIVEELQKCFALPAEALGEALEAYFGLQIFEVIFPELQMMYNYDQHNPYHDFKLHEHVIKVVVNLRKTITVGEENFNEKLWAALLHDVGKPFTAKMHPKIPMVVQYVHHELVGAQIAAKFLLAYKFSNKAQAFIVESIEKHLEDSSFLRPFDNMSKKKDLNSSIVEDSNKEGANERGINKG